MDVWFPSRQSVERAPFVDLHEVNDFDEVLELYQGDQLRRQLSAGKFEGKVVRCDLGGIQFKVEKNSRDIELEAYAKHGMIAFAVIVGQKKPFLTYGVERDLDTVTVTPPFANVHSLFPEDGTIAFAFIEPERLLNSLSMAPDVADWLMSLGKQPTPLKAPFLAKRLRSDILYYLNCALTLKRTTEQSVLCEITIRSLALALTFDFLSRKQENTRIRSRSFEVFQKVRLAMFERAEQIPELLLPSLPGISMKRRALETAFAKSVGLPPAKYFRVHRLHRARRKLLDRNRFDESIGDIAAEEGFWEWSRFSQYYSAQFGELPSETRYNRGRLPVSDR